MHYLDPRGVPESDNASYLEAERNWQRKVAKIEALETLHFAKVDAETSPSIVTALSLVNAQQAADAERAAVTAPEALRDISNAVAFADFSAMLARQQGTSNDQQSPATIEGLVGLYVADKQQEADAGQISIEMLKEHRRNLQVFSEFARDSNRIAVDQIDSRCLDEYRRCILALTNAQVAEEADAQQLGPVTIKKRLARLKQFIEWAYANGHLRELPRNLKGYTRVKSEADPSLTVGKKRWAVGECRELFEASSERTQLYICLALNCGYGATDIATLLHDHVDWDLGIIQRSRHKTGTKQAHRLWPLTAALLKKHCTKRSRILPGGGPLLLGNNGLPLVNYDADNGCRNDAIRLSLDRTLEKIIRDRIRRNEPGLFARSKQGDKVGQAKREKEIKRAVSEERQKETRGFYAFRGTSADMIEKQYGTGSKLADQFLAHTEKATKRWYVDRHFDLLFEAIGWLDSQFQFSELPSQKSEASAIDCTSAISA
ncbi:MAG: phage integrase SAM-like domain-containing protein [Planctomycetia bacterium]|nr:phage integrase SAM-like domain-containing protein [Planctomycetia bacterium]